MRLYIDGHAWGYELQRVAGLFLYGEKIVLTEGAPGDIAEAEYIYTWVCKDSGAWGVFARLFGDDGSERYVRCINGVLTECVGCPWTELQREGAETGKGAEASAECRRRASCEEDELTSSAQAVQEHCLGAALYRALRTLTGLRPPWGMLTGIRPVSLARRCRSKGMDDWQVRRYLKEDCFVSSEKLELALETEALQRPILERDTADSVSLYVSIPFCPTRCAYCSFVSQALRQVSKHIPEYVEALCRELEELGALMKILERPLRTVYLGGGTPTTLTAEQLRRILEAIQRIFDTAALWEYTVEAGRPDTVTEEKLSVLRSFGVDRISVNPQSTNDSVLCRIGRGHTAADFFHAADMVRKTGFGCVNMDLIAGLPGDTPEGFYKSLEDVLALEPENVTIHTLAKKRGAALSYSDVEQEAAVLARQVSDGRQRLSESGFSPYYLYRQAGSYFGLENVGYTRPGQAGLYNVYSMEESHTILAAGAGGVTKLVQRDTGQIKRVFNYKYPFEYLRQFETVLARKKQIFHELP